MTKPTGEFLEGYEYEPDAKHFLLNRNGSADEELPLPAYGNDFSRYTDDYRTPSACWYVENYHSIQDFEDAFEITFGTTYHIEAYYKSIDPAGLSRLYFGWVCWDRDGGNINHQQVNEYPTNDGTTHTYLAQELNNNDTEIYVNDVSSWSIFTSGAIDYRQYVALYPYQDYPDYTYTRYVYYFYGINYNQNKIILQNPWSAGTFPSGSAISQHFAGGTYMYSAAGAAIVPSGTWTIYDADTGGIWAMNNGTGPNWRYGTKYVSPLWLINYPTGDGNQMLMDNLAIWSHDPQERLSTVNLRTPLGSKKMSVTPEGCIEVNEIVEGQDRMFIEVNTSGSGVLHCKEINEVDGSNLGEANTKAIVDSQGVVYTKN